jgi:branched-chain amino acid aminotransferase
MEHCLLTHYLENKEFKSSCDFDYSKIEKQKSIYEVIRVINGIPIFIEDHLNRFFASLEIKKIKTQITKEQILSQIKALIEINKTQNCNIKFLMQIENKDFFAWINPFFYPSTEQKHKGVSCSLMQSVRKIPNSKTSNPELKKKAKKETEKNNTFETILFDAKNIISEGSRSNLFFIKNGIVFTSPDDKVLLGVTRKMIIEVCESLNIEIRKITIKTDKINEYDAAFLSGTSINLLPISSIESHTYNINNQILINLQNVFQKLLTEYLNSFRWNL